MSERIASGNYLKEADFRSTMKQIESAIMRFIKFQPGRHQADAYNRWWRGFRAIKKNVACDTGMKHGEEVARELHTKPSAKNISESRLHRRVRFRSCGTVGYGPTLCVQSRKSGDILHGYDSKACLRIACQLCWHQRWYQGRGTKRTIFLFVERGGPVGKVLVHRWLPECHH